MKTQHTPGPWHADTGPKTLDSDHRVVEIHSSTGGKTGDGNVIATIHGDIFNHTVPLIEEAKANAKLIAAAPELLEALKSIADENYDDDDKKHHLYAIIDRMKSIANEAIKKAEL